MTKTLQNRPAIYSIDKRHVRILNNNRTETVAGTEAMKSERAYIHRDIYQSFGRRFQNIIMGAHVTINGEYLSNIRFAGVNSSL